MTGHATIITRSQATNVDPAAAPSADDAPLSGGSIMAQLRKEHDEVQTLQQALANSWGTIIPPLRRKKTDSRPEVSSHSHFVYGGTHGEYT